jgi:hypothetical protein
MGGSPTANRIAPRLISSDESTVIGEVLDEARALPAPSGVSPDVFASLKRSFIEQLSLSVQSKFTARAPEDEANRVTDLAFNFRDEAYWFVWSYRNVGDYNQDGEVSIPDITPIAQHFGHTRAGIGIFPDQEDEVIDGDDNGDIGIPDITPIAQNYLVNVARYAIEIQAYSTGPFAEIDSVSLGEAEGEGRRRIFRHKVLPEVWDAWRIRVLPYDAQGNPGIPSVEIEPLVNGNKLPRAALTATPSSGVAPLTVMLNANGSYDDDGGIVAYIWDYQGDGVFDQNTGSQSWMERVYSVPGQYNVTVKVKDDKSGYGYANTLVTVI